MIFTVGATAFIIIVVALFFALQSMRTIDKLSLVFRMITNLNLIRLIPKNSQLTEVTISNWHKILAPHKLFKHALEQVLKFKMRDDDVIVSTYPKAGTTWMQELVWLICNKADIGTAKTTYLSSRFGFLEVLDGQGLGDGHQTVERWPKEKTRFIKTHLPFELLPNELQQVPRGKMIYVVRNPKDCSVSFYHFMRMNKPLPDPGAWNEFFPKFIAGKVLYGSWFTHLEKYWKVFQERKDNMYIISYESLQKDLKGEVVKLAAFLEKDLSAVQIDTIVEHCSFTSMSKNEMTNYSYMNKSSVMDFRISKFMRKGKVGDWKNHFTINDSLHFDKVFEERTKNWKMAFDFELAN